MQLFSAFDICGGCRKLTYSYDDDVGGCLPLTRRRNGEGRGQNRRSGLNFWVRLTILVLLIVVLLIIVLSLGHPETKVVPLFHELCTPYSAD